MSLLTRPMPYAVTWADERGERAIHTLSRDEAEREYARLAREAAHFRPALELGDLHIKGEERWR